MQNISKNKKSHWRKSINHRNKQKINIEKWKTWNNLAQIFIQARHPSITYNGIRNPPATVPKENTIRKEKFPSAIKHFKSPMLILISSSPKILGEHTMERQFLQIFDIIITFTCIALRCLVYFHQQSAKFE